VDLNGTCITMTSKSAGLSGCMIPSQIDKSKCKVCSPGWTMVNVGACREEVPPGPPVPNPKRIGLMSVKVVFLTLAAFLF